MQGCTITLGTHALLLLPQRAVWWAATRSLIITDLHLGKGATFRSAGVPVPEGSTRRDLERVSDLLRATEARRLIMLGDFFHSRAGRHPEVHDAIATWREGHAPVEVLLVRGNHDRSAGFVLAEWNITEHEDPSDCDGLTLAHHPLDSAAPAVCGHVHPVFTLLDFDRSMVRVPCFVVRNNVLMLPSFGSLTGGHSIRHQPGQSIYLAAGTRVLPAPVSSTDRPERAPYASGRRKGS